MEADENKKVFEVFMGNKVSGSLTDRVIAGHAIHYAGEDHYLLRLMMIPNVSYYLAKNPGSQATYTVFTKCIKNADKLKFQNPVGFAQLSNDLKTHMEIQLPLFRVSVFMSLFPKYFQKGA